MTDPNAELLQPDPRTLILSRHPNHELGDVVSIQFDTHEGNRYVLVVDVDTADYLAAVLASAVHSPKVIAAVDQMHAEQRDGLR